jgi:hypothetical protein
MNQSDFAVTIRSVSLREDFARKRIVDTSVQIA